MKRAFLLTVVPVLLVALGLAQTPAASTSADQTKLKGCLGGSVGNYTVVEDTGQIVKIATSGIDLNSHLGQLVTLIGQRASGGSSAAADNSFAVAGLTMISEHCATAAAAPVATTSVPAETAVTPASAATGPDASVSTPADTAGALAVAATAPVPTYSKPADSATPPAANAAPLPAYSKPAETPSAPASAATVPAAAMSTPSETASTPGTTVTHTTRSAHSRRLPAAPPASATTPDSTASTPAEPDSTPVTTPAVTASVPSDTVGDPTAPAATAATPAAAAATPAVTAKGGSLALLIAFAVLIIVIGTLTPLFSRWRKRKMLERTGAQNLSFDREASSEEGKSDEPAEHKAA